jgi:hypothetical protein
MKRSCLFIILFCIFIHSVSCQVNENSDNRIIFHGLVLDNSTLLPIANSQIAINRIFTSVSGEDGTFAFYVNRNDTVVFSSLGYKSLVFYVGDTLSGREFIAGIYMHTDTLSIGEVVIIPRLNNLKSEILNARSKTPSIMENAKYNVAISAYQGRNSVNKLGDPSSNYEVLRQKQRVDAYEKGGIPSDNIVGLSPFLLIPAAYLLIHGLPEKPVPMKSELTKSDIDKIQKKYFETLKQRK